MGSWESAVRTCWASTAPPSGPQLPATRPSRSLWSALWRRGDDNDDSDHDFLARFKDGASLFDQAGLKLELEELLGGDVDVISAGGLKDKHRGILQDAIAL